LQENLLTIANTGPVLTLIFLDDSFKSQLGSWWPSKNYSVAFLVGNISSFITTSIVLGYPIALYYLYWYKVLPVAHVSNALAEIKVSSDSPIIKWIGRSQVKVKEQ
jgi:hypothetical protein